MRAILKRYDSEGIEFLRYFHGPYFCREGDTGATVWTNAVTKVGNVEKRDVSAVVSAMSNTMDGAMQDLVTPLPAEMSRSDALKRN